MPTIAFRTNLQVLGHKAEILVVEKGKEVFPRELEYIYIESDFLQQVRSVLHGLPESP